MHYADFYKIKTVYPLKILNFAQYELLKELKVFLVYNIVAVDISCSEVFRVSAEDRSLHLAKVEAVYLTVAVEVSDSVILDLLVGPPPVHIVEIAFSARKYEIDIVLALSFRDAAPLSAPCLPAVSALDVHSSDDLTVGLVKAHFKHSSCAV